MKEIEKIIKQTGLQRNDVKIKMLINGEARFQDEIHNQDNVSNTIYEVKGNFNAQLKNVLHGKRCWVNSIDVDDDSLSFVSIQEVPYDKSTGTYKFKGDEKKRYITEDNEGASLNPEKISFSFDRITRNFQFLFLVHGSQYFITSLDTEYMNEVTFTVSVYTYSSFYELMILNSINELGQYNLRDAFIFARIAYEGWLNEVCQNEQGKSWKIKYERYYGTEPESSFEIKLGEIRNKLVHANENADSIARVLKKEDVITQLNLIAVDLDQRQTLLNNWKNQSIISGKNINKFKYYE